MLRGLGVFVVVAVGNPPPHPKRQPRTHAIFSKSESLVPSDNFTLDKLFRDCYNYIAERLLNITLNSKQAEQEKTKTSDQGKSTRPTPSKSGCFFLFMSHFETQFCHKLSMGKAEQVGAGSKGICPYQPASIRLQRQ